ncbi:hypothetical protein [Micromonospora sp. RP3T]|uniref:hypothetical protein n=1 Tax=Micromonospora sp. RP3T TaxID=2135446 RepID=UPI003D716C8B
MSDGGVLAWALVAGGLLTSLLTLYAIARVWNLAFWRDPYPDMPGPDDTARAARTDGAEQPHDDRPGHRLVLRWDTFSWANVISGLASA